MARPQHPPRRRTVQEIIEALEAAGFAVTLVDHRPRATRLVLMKGNQRTQIRITR